MSKKIGRPIGAKDIDRELNDVEPSRCPKCGSTDRTRYTAKTVVNFDGVSPKGQPYTSIVLRYTQCANENCRQHRIDRFFMDDRG